MKRRSTWTASLAWAAVMLGNGPERPSPSSLSNGREEID